MIRVLFIVNILSCILKADFNCSSSNNCTVGIYTCDPNQDCNIDCFGKKACSGSIFNCPDNYKCIVNVYDESGMDGTTIKGRNSSNLTIRCTGLKGCARMNINCPAHGVCDIGVGGNCYQCFFKSKIMSENTTKLLYIHDDGNKYTTTTYMLQNSQIYCPSSTSEQYKCIIDLLGEWSDNAGYFAYKLYRAHIYALASFNDVLLTCRGLYPCCYPEKHQPLTVCPQMHCGSPSDQSICRMKPTKSGEWVCQNSSSKCVRYVSENANSICPAKDLGFVRTTYELSVNEQTCVDGITRVISKLVDIIDIIYHQNQLFVYSNITQQQRNEFIYLEQAEFCGRITVQILTCFDD
eukprot:142291_1